MNISLIGVPITYGCSLDGAQYGPAKLRQNKIIDLIKQNGHVAYDLGDIVVPNVPKEEKYSGHKNIKYLHPVTEVNTNLAHKVYCSLKGETFPFIMGGDHSIGMGSIAGSSKYFNEMAVIWIDAHTDVNTHETSPSGNPHGMPLSASIGEGHPNFTNIYYNGQKVKPENVFIIGARSIDGGEIDFVRKLGVGVYTMKSIREMGLKNVLEEVIRKIKSSNVDGVHLSFDIDVLEPSLVPGTGTPEPDGFSLDEGKFTIERLLKEKFVTSMDFVELNPTLDDSETTIKTCMEILDHTFKYL